ncbi:hypothetical protein [Amycolatopsis sp. lyj-109]|uniref:hypothetical protein n=1 Tax=Amycolatopsis sp. lyj-109 TaxID=2789287 RepID=UPI003979FC6E
MRNGPGVPQLRHDPAAERVHDVRDPPPPVDLGVHPGNVREADSRSLTQGPSVTTSPARCA